LIEPIGPLAATERVSATFTPCGPARGSACVIDGDTFKLGDRTVRITGIDAPELAAPRCPAEAALARRAADRLLALLNRGPFDMVAHRLQREDRHGRDLMVIRRDGNSIGGQLTDEGLAHRYIGSKRSWC
jgi:micrococcal nuclease